MLRNCSEGKIQSVSAGQNKAQSLPNNNPNSQEKTCSAE
jgi:hypothetical protein